MKQKRGQVTVFIIVGIIILLTATIAFYITQRTAVVKPERVVPPEVEPISDFIDNCVEIVGEECVRLLAANGGYLEFPPEVKNNPEASIRFSPLADTRVPLWSYQGLTAIPSQQKMEYDIEQYLDENLPSCLNNLDQFRQQFDINETENITTEAELTDNGVSIEVTYPLEIESKIRKQKIPIETFRADIPLRLKTVYELAKTILEQENEDAKLEELTLELITLDPQLPYTDMEFSCSPKVWYVNEVRDRLSKLLTADIPLIKIENTDYLPVPDSRPYEKNHFIWDITERKYPTTAVSFTYDQRWPLDMYIRPSDGNLLKSNSQKGFDLLGFFCMHLWHFTYDVKYPVKVTITDEAADGHDRLDFNFGFDVLINHNQPDRSSFGIESFDFEQLPQDVQYCEETRTHEMTVTTYDNISTETYGDLLETIKDVNISYTCLRRTCNMGETGNFGELRARFPYCINGILRGTKEGYAPAMKFVSSNEPKDVELHLTPIKEIENYKVVKHYMHTPGIAQELSENEMTAITVKRNTLQSSGIYAPEKIEAFEDIEEIEDVDTTPLPITLLRGGEFQDYTYDITIYLISGDIMTGGYKGQWTVPSEALEDSDEIVFHVYEWPYTQTTEKIAGHMAKIAEYSAEIPAPELR
ncbi:hypothetical protein GF336_01715 [Candidatus Woesearchaeota archaeon]|nr:hypothetical protein [Candidatus Woesearchaeota archaeon]